MDQTDMGLLNDHYSLQNYSHAAVPTVYHLSQYSFSFSFRL